jgi:hypothetical protein
MLLRHPVPRAQGALFRYLFAYYPILYPWEDGCKLTLILDIGHPAPANKVFGKFIVIVHLNETRLLNRDLFSFYYSA